MTNALPESVQAASPPLRREGIEAIELGKVFPDSRVGKIVAAEGISFTCWHGEVFGLLGPNGAGKSTTLRMLATVLEPTAGTARVAGRDIRQEPLEVRRAIGYLSSTTGLYGRLTARETLEYFGSLHGIEKKALRERVDELLRLFEIASFADIRCEKLSTGMRQKVSIARAIVHDPPVLILDEPTLGLDILIARTMVRFIEDCRSRGKCIILSTHILSEVDRLCDRLAIIHKGRLRGTGTLQDLRLRTGAQYVEDIFVNLVGE